MPQRFLTKIKVGKLSFQDIAKQAKLPGVTTKKFKDKAFGALRKAKYGENEAKSIIGGHKKMEHSTLKKVLNQLQKAKVIKKGPSTVTNYVKTEKARQERMIRLHLRERADELEKEKKAEQKAEKSGKKKEEKKEAAVPLASGGFGVPENKQTDGQIEQSLLPSPKVNFRKSKSENPEKGQNIEQSEKPKELSDMEIG